MSRCDYVLLTAAKNEQSYITDAIESILRQTILPRAWFIMDDGSSDQTAQIVGRFAASHPFIHLSSAGSREGRNFGSQYKALQAAYQMARPLAYEFIGAQDADIAPERADYYETILAEFGHNPRLGVAGGFIYERANGQWRCRKDNSRDSVAGGVQMFRRTCFDQIGGYRPLYFGGSDTLALLEAQMLGWEILTRPDQKVFHYRPSSSAGGRWRGMFRSGLEDASFGYHPVFELFKCARRMATRPYVLGSAVRLGGYLSWKLSGRAAVIPAEKVAFLKKEQMAKLRRCLWPLARTRPQA
jgi:glycosyltransferase involved in cell wall biosynthesis